MGHDVELFTTEPGGDFVCPVCTDVLEQPVVLPCGHHFCRECLHAVLQRNDACPVCRAPSQLADVQPAVNLVRNVINALEVRCPHHADGCLHVGKLELLANHLALTCPLERVPCTIAGCSEQVLRQDLAAHRASCPNRLGRCRHEGCGAVVPVRALQDHEDGCEHRLVACPLGCGQSLAPAEVQAHTTHHCAKLRTMCRMEGCEFEAERGDGDVWRAHMRDPGHIAFLARAVQQLEDQNGALVVRLEAQASTIRNQEALLQNFARLGDRIAAQEQASRELRARVDAQAAQLRAREEEIQRLEATIHQQRRSIEAQANDLVAQREDAAKDQAALELVGGQLAPRGFSARERNEVVWVLDNFAAARREGKMVSSPELTFSDVGNARHRYSFRLNCFPNGLKSEQSVGAVGLYFLPRRGPNHRALDWPMACNFTLAVLNHETAAHRAFVLETNGRDREYFARCRPPPKRAFRGRGMPALLSPEQVASGHFTRNNCLVVRVIMNDGVFVV